MIPMTIRYPPRREPRVLAVGSSPFGLDFAAADPWVVRSAGHGTCRPRSRVAALARLVRREKPTALIGAGPGLRRTLRHVGRAQGIPVVTDPVPHLPRAIATELYPELPLLAPGRLGRLAATAISAVLHAHIPPRRYEPRRHRTPARRAR
jgi:hypothetical protein